MHATTPDNKDVVNHRGILDVCKFSSLRSEKLYTRKYMKQDEPMIVVLVMIPKSLSKPVSSVPIFVSNIAFFCYVIL